MEQDKIIAERYFIKSINGEETVQDMKTGLIWTRRAARVNWMEAARYAKIFEYGGYSDWRIPTFEQLKTLFKNREKNTPPSLYNWEQEVWNNYDGCMAGLYWCMPYYDFGGNIRWGICFNEYLLDTNPDEKYYVKYVRTDNPEIKDYRSSDIFENIKYLEMFGMDKSKYSKPFLERWNKFKSSMGSVLDNVSEIESNKEQFLNDIALCICNGIRGDRSEKGVLFPWSIKVNTENLLAGITIRAAMLRNRVLSFTSESEAVKRSPVIFEIDDLGEEIRQDVFFLYWLIECSRKGHIPLYFGDLGYWKLSQGIDPFLFK